MAESCSCNITGLFDIDLTGIISVSMSSNTDINMTSSEVILVGPSTGTISMSAYPFARGASRLGTLLGATCPSTARAECKWVQKYSCEEGKMYFLPAFGGSASITGGGITTVVLESPEVTYRSLNVDASSGPASPYLEGVHTDGFNLIYTGLPIGITSGRPQSYSFLSNVLPADTDLYLSSFEISVTPPNPATVSYNFVFAVGAETV